MKASIFIPTKNGADSIEKTLQSIFKQNEKDFEVIIVDSGSTDETIQIIKKFPIRLYEIDQSEFTHGKTRNLAITYSSSEYIIFLSQDAIPKNNIWLEEIIEPFKNSKVAGVYSKQVPKSNARAYEVFFYKSYFGIDPKINSLPNINPEKIFFSNASSAIRKEVLEKFPFNDGIIMSEDQEWSKRVLLGGFKTVYAPNSIVIHSHDYNFVQTIRRYFDSALSMKQILKDDFENLTKHKTDYIIRELAWVSKNKPIEIPKLVFNNIAKIIGSFFGVRNRLLPNSIKKILSMHSYHWNKNK